jgi:preprotein translocase subunit SecF
MGSRTSAKKVSFDKGRIDFVGKVGFFGVFSVGLVVGAILIMMTKGLNYGIDFAGGTEVQVKFAQPVNVEDLRKAVEGMTLNNLQVQSFSGAEEFLIRFQSPTGATDKETNENIKKAIAQVTETLNTSFAAQGPEIRRVGSVGPQVGEELKRNAVLAVFYSLFIILIYVALRFDYKYAPGAVFCLFHDAILVVGIFALIGQEMNVQIMAAILTLIGYSLNDTIVNYDRIRENIQLYPDVPLEWIINRSINDMLGRTILTFVTVLIAVACLFIWGGGVIREIAMTLGLGLLIGTYSSFYVAVPLVLIGEKLKTRTAA